MQVPEREYVDPCTDEDVDIDDVIRKTLSSYKPGSTRNLQVHGFKRVCLQLFGRQGHGKSSLINSCLCVVHNLPFNNDAGAGKSSKSFTTARKEYKLTDTVYIIDNPGLDRMSNKERLELSAQFRNLRSISKVDWELELERTVNQLEDRWDNRPMDFIVPVLVYSGAERSYNFQNEIAPFLSDAFEITGIFPIVVLTKKNTQNTPEIVKVIEELGSQHIFIVDNYTTTNSTRNVNTDSQVLQFLHMCLQEADRGIEKKQSSNIQREFLTQVTDQIKAEMKIYKELKEESIQGKERELIRKDSEISRQATDIRQLKNEVADLTRKLDKALSKKKSS